MTNHPKDALKMRSRIPTNPAIRTPDWVACGGCGQKWTGIAAAHCGACHRTFTGTAAFDIHRSGGECRDPATIIDKHGNPRLVPIERQHWSGWGSPSSDDGTEWWDR
jgi:hypothetical protein